MLQVQKFNQFLAEKVDRENKPIQVAVITKTNPNLKKRKVGGKENLTLEFLRELKQRTASFFDEMSCEIYHR